MLLWGSWGYVCDIDIRFLESTRELDMWRAPFGVYLYVGKSKLSAFFGCVGTVRILSKVGDFLLPLRYKVTSTFLIIMRANLGGKWQPTTAPWLSSVTPCVGQKRFPLSLCARCCVLRRVVLCVVCCVLCVELIHNLSDLQMRLGYSANINPSSLLGGGKYFCWQLVMRHSVRVIYLFSHFLSILSSFLPFFLSFFLPPSFLSFLLTFNLIYSKRLERK
jgi:hypothetical protein